jgi:hypothetical protein
VGVASWTTAAKVLSAVRRGSRFGGAASDGKQEPLRSFGIRRSTIPTLVSQSRSRLPSRCTSRSGLCSPRAAPVSASTSSSISRLAAKPIIRAGFGALPQTASVPFARSSRRAVSCSVIVGIQGRGCVSQPDPTQGHRGGRLLHHAPGHDPTHVGELRLIPLRPTL